jgi:hypothetical protein
MPLTKGDSGTALTTADRIDLAAATVHGPYATLTALQAAVPAAAGLAGQVARVGAAAPFVLYRCDGAAWLRQVPEDGKSGDIADQAAGQPTETVGGAAITYRSNGAPVVASGGFLTSGAGTGQRAWYAERYMPAGCKRLGAEFKFTAGTTGRNGAIALILWAASSTEDADIPPTPLHFTCSRWGWTVGNLPNQNGTITNYGSGRFNRTLLTDTVYTVDISVDRGRAYIRLPDGTTVSAANPALSTTPGVYPGWEFYQFDGATDDLVAIGRVWMDDADQALSGSPGMAAALLDIPRRPTAKGLSSLASSSIGTAAAHVDSAAVCPVYSGPAGSAEVICRFTGWVNLAAGRSLILAPKFVDIDGATVTQPYMFGYTAPGGAAYSGPFVLEMVQAVASSKPVNCELWAQSTGAGDSFTVAANKPLTMQFIPLG